MWTISINIDDKGIKKVEESVAKLLDYHKDIRV
jgi:hypothetical protein